MSFIFITRAEDCAPGRRLVKREAPIGYHAACSVFSSAYFSSPRPDVRSRRSDSSSTGASRRCAASCPTARRPPLGHPPPPRSGRWRPARTASRSRPAARPTRAGPAGVASYDLTAMGGYDEIDRFFGRLALSHRLIDVETPDPQQRPGERDSARRPPCASPSGPPGARCPPPPETSGAAPKGGAPAGARGLPPRPGPALWPSPRRSPGGGGPDATRACSSPSCPRWCASGRWCSAYASLGETFTVRGLAVGEGTVPGVWRAASSAASSASPSS